MGILDDVSVIAWAGRGVGAAASAARRFRGGGSRRRPRSSRFAAALGLVALLALAAHAWADGGAEGVTFRSGDLRLAGTLTLPVGQGPFPALAMISGSGPQTREGEVPGVPGYGLFADLAPFLADRGIAVLRYDDRGVGESEGDLTLATSADLAEDAEAAVAFLQSRPEVDPLRIGLLGHSEGAMIAPMIAARHPGVAFVISLAPPVADALEGLVRQERLLLETEGMPQELVDEQVATTRRALELTRAEDWPALEVLLHDLVERQLAALPDEARAGFGDLEVAADALVAQTMTQYRGWMRSFLSHDAAADWERVRVPALAVFAARDVQVDATLHRPVLRAVADAGLVSIVTLPRANHLFQEARTGGVTEYAELAPEPTVALFDALGEWTDLHVTR